MLEQVVFCGQRDKLMAVTLALSTGRGCYISVPAPLLAAVPFAVVPARKQLLSLLHAIPAASPGSRWVQEGLTDGMGAAPINARTNFLPRQQPWGRCVHQLSTLGPHPPGNKHCTQPLSG